MQRWAAEGGRKWQYCAVHTLSATRAPGAAASGRRPHLAPALGVLALVLTGHALLLGGLPAGHAPAGQQSPAAKPASVLQTRQILALAVHASPAMHTAAPEQQLARPPEAVAPQTPTRPARSATSATSAVTAASPAIVEAVLAAAEPTPSAEPLLRLVAASQAAAPPASASARHSGEGTEGTEVPVYATRLPPAARMQYELRRGALRGSGQLVWLPGEATYGLSLEGSAFGALLIGQSSSGGFDAAGIAPLRFLDRRRGRDEQAANFQRERSLITFSGPDVQVALQPGTQDRLSWMLQLPAIIEAAPARFVPGTHITLFVVGARGEASVWTFDVEARETITLPAGTLAGALRLKREPRKPYDTQIEVWLDPARHHLPVRVRQAVSQGGDATEFLLRSLGPP